MKKTLIAALMISSVSAVYADDSVSLDTKEQKLGYSIGSMFGGRMAADFSELDVETFLAGFKDAYAGSEPQITHEEMQTSIQNYQQEQVAKAQAEQEKLAAEQQEKADAWFADIAKQDGVQKTESGLMYKVITEGDGAKPAATDTVEVDYAGTLMDGTEFDSSYSRGESVTFQLNQVIPGWTEGLQLMSVGSKYELYIPSELAYGPGGTGPIPPNSPLKFVVELHGIEAPAATEE